MPGFTPQDFAPTPPAAVTDIWDQWLAPLEAADHAHVPVRVADVLRRAISAGQILPGTKLPEVKITARLGVSRHTLRSAFQMLAADGLVDRRPNRGVFVHEPTGEDVREIYRIRLILETGAVRTSVFPPEATQQLKQITRGAERAREAGDVLAMGQANQEFHQRLVAQARSAMLDELMSKVLARMRLVFAGRLGDPDFHAAYVAGNVKLAELLSRNRRQEAEEHLVNYLLSAEQDLLRRLKT
jgi:DNA-binding GntR family transcriptional regulator